MNRTKNDLSFDHVKLDYEAMLLTSKIAFGRLADSIMRRTEDLRSWNPKTTYGLACSWIEEDARQLVIVGETLSALEGCSNRNNIEIVNITRKDDEKEQ